LKEIDPKREAARDKLTEYLDRETKAATIKLHEPDATNEIMNQDILLPYRSESIEYEMENYNTPMKVLDRYKEFPKVDELTRNL